MRLLHAGRESRRFYDINLRKGSWQPSLVLELMELATMVKLNVDEAREVSRMLGGSSGSLEKFCRTYAARFHWQGICVTNGAQGCALLWEDEFVEAEGYAVRAKDTVGSGDAFAAALLHGLACGWPLMRAADFANRVGAIVASREGAIPGWTIAEVEGLSHNSNSRSHPESQNRETA